MSFYKSDVSGSGGTRSVPRIVIGPVPVTDGVVGGLGIQISGACQQNNC